MLGHLPLVCVPQPQHFVVEELWSMADALDVTCQLKCQRILSVKFEVVGSAKCRMTPREVLQFTAGKEELKRSGQVSAIY